MVIARGMRPTLNVSSTSFWNPSFSSRMATGNKPPYAVRLLPSKSYGVEAPILLGSGITRSAPCGTRLSSLCSLLRLTIWVTPRSRLAKLELRGLSVLQQDFRGPQVVLSFSPSYSTQRPCIGQVVTPGCGIPQPVPENEVVSTRGEGREDSGGKVALGDRRRVGGSNVIALEGGRQPGGALGIVGSGVDIVGARLWTGTQGKRAGLRDRGRRD